MGFCITLSLTKEGQTLGLCAITCNLLLFFPLPLGNYSLLIMSLEVEDVMGWEFLVQQHCQIQLHQELTAQQDQLITRTGQ
jgi:hypothetical protein